eukprot:TRINITY_DN10353_c0_g2_i2.p1 TRINITY_DN10353_c0_g2~~TRINITY_DN10353_c0_g2_i2.p1  ORF type:complete len:807 (+),score=150.58 TRINITY_DN10353_c0_g2_i2:98-2518(+)
MAARGAARPEEAALLEHLQRELPPLQPHVSLRSWVTPNMVLVRFVRKVNSKGRLDVRVLCLTPSAIFLCRPNGEVRRFVNLPAVERAAAGAVRRKHGEIAPLLLIQLTPPEHDMLLRLDDDIRNDPTQTPSTVLDTLERVKLLRGEWSGIEGERGAGDVTRRARLKKPPGYLRPLQRLLLSRSGGDTLHYAAQARPGLYPSQPPGGPRSSLPPPPAPEVDAAPAPAATAVEGSAGSAGQCSRRASTVTVQPVDEDLPVPSMPWFEPSADPSAQGALLEQAASEGRPEFSFPADRAFWDNFVAQVGLYPGASDPPRFDVAASHCSKRLMVNRDFLKRFVSGWERANPHLVTVTGPRGVQTFHASDEFWQRFMQQAGGPNGPRGSGRSEELLTVSSQLHPAPVASSLTQWRQFCADWEREREARAARPDAAELPQEGASAADTQGDRRSGTVPPTPAQPPLPELPRGEQWTQTTPPETSPPTPALGPVIAAAARLSTASLRAEAARSAAQQLRSSWPQDASTQTTAAAPATAPLPWRSSVLPGPLPTPASTAVSPAPPPAGPLWAAAGRWCPACGFPVVPPSGPLGIHRPADAASTPPPPEPPDGCAPPPYRYFTPPRTRSERVFCRPPSPPPQPPPPPPQPPPPQPPPPQPPPLPPPLPPAPLGTPASSADPPPWPSGRSSAGSAARDRRGGCECSPRRGGVGERRSCRRAALFWAVFTAELERAHAARPAPAALAAARQAAPGRGSRPADPFPSATKGRQPSPPPSPASGPAAPDCTGGGTGPPPWLRAAPTDLSPRRYRHTAPPL